MSESNNHAATIQAAISRLEELREAPDYYPDYHPALGTAEDFDLAIGKIATLNRTVAAQVAVLQSVTVADWSRPSQIDSDALALARAILGESDAYGKGTCAACGERPYGHDNFECEADRG